MKRSTSGSTYRRIGELGHTRACYISAGWREEGIVAMHCLRTVPGGGHAMGSYLVDLWCVGLKDAYGRLEITHDEFDHGVIGPMRERVDLVRVNVDVVRRLVAGGIRFANQNGFRLPPRYERWVSLLGGLGDVETADLSDFGCEGKLHYVGTLEDLEKRLVVGSAEEFLRRPDVSNTLGLADSWSGCAESEMVEEMIEGIKAKGLLAVREWCFGSGVAPHPLLAEVWDMTLEAIVQSGIPEDEADLCEEADEEAVVNLNRLLGFEDVSVRAELMDALTQLQAFIGRFDSYADFSAAMAVDTAEEDSREMSQPKLIR